MSDRYVSHIKHETRGRAAPEASALYGIHTVIRHNISNLCRNILETDVFCGYSLVTMTSNKPITRRPVQLAIAVDRVLCVALFPLT